MLCKIGQVGKFLVNFVQESDPNISTCSCFVSWRRVALHGFVLYLQSGVAAHCISLAAAGWVVKCKRAQRAAPPTRLLKSFCAGL